MMSKMDEIFKRVLNDKDIFWIKKVIFSGSEWSVLKETSRQPTGYENAIQQKMQELKAEENKVTTDGQRKDIKNSMQLCNKLLNALEQKRNIINQMFDYLDSYGLVKCNLPSMDDYGKVIERYGISTIEQFFLDKIKRENNQHKKKALAKVLEYVKELYNSNQSPLEIAYFVRKIDSLSIFWEV
jgi:hypothetical protein